MASCSRESSLLSCSCARDSRPREKHAAAGAGAPTAAAPAAAPPRVPSPAHPSRALAEGLHGEVSGSGHAASAASTAAAGAAASPSLANAPGALAEGSRAPARSGLDTDGMIIALRFDLGLGLAASSGFGLGLAEAVDGTAASALRRGARRMGRLGSAERARVSEKEPPSEKEELRESESDFQPPPPPIDGSVLDKELLVLDEEHDMRRSAWKPARAEEARDPAEEARVDVVLRISSAMSSGLEPVGLGF